MGVTTILVAEQVERMVRRLAYEVVEHNRGADGLYVVGILSRGDVFGRQITREIERICGHPVPYAALDVSPFRDDGRRAGEPATDLPSFEGRDVLLADDVLFTGRTVRAALDAVVRRGRPASIQLAVLVDRGHREYPIHPDYIGRKIPTKHRERVEVDLGDAAGVRITE